MKEFLKPVNLGVAVVLDLIPSLRSADDCAKRYEQDVSILCFWVRYTRESLMVEKKSMGKSEYVI